MFDGHLPSEAAFGDTFARFVGRDVFGATDDGDGDGDELSDDGSGVLDGTRLLSSGCAGPEDVAEPVPTIFTEPLPETFASENPLPLMVIFGVGVRSED